MKNSIYACGLFAVLLAACSTPKDIAYFQDVTDEAVYFPAPKEIKIEPKDKLSIIVNSQDTRLTNQFNLPIISQQVGVESSYNQSRGLSGYTVDSEGNIDFPVLGTIHVGGLTREQVAKKIKKELIDQDLVKNPVVTVEFMNLTIGVMGEVKHPGRFHLDKDNVTVLDAISEAGDMTIQGQRVITVLRTEGGKQVAYKIDLTKAESIYSSPAYYLQQNDIVYIEPNDRAKRESTVNGNALRSTSFWISLASLLTTVCVLIFK